MQPIYCQSKKLSRQSLFTLSYVQLFNIYFFSKSFLLPFNQCLGASYLIFGVGLVVKASCCQIILYILHFARFPIPIFKIKLVTYLGYRHNNNYCSDLYRNITLGHCNDLASLARTYRPPGNISWYRLKVKLILYQYHFFYYYYYYYYHYTRIADPNN